MKIRIASTLLALALPLVAQEPTASQVEATFYKAFYLEKGPRRFEEASALYTKFLAAAPEHKLAKEAAKQQYRLLDRLGKSKERDAFKAKYGELIGKIAAGGTRPQRGGDAGGRPGRGEGNDRGGRGERGEGGRGGRGERGQGGRGGRRRGGIMGLMRNDTKLADMSKEQLEELKSGLESASSTIDRMERFLGEEAAAKMRKSTEAMKKALDAGKTEEAQKELDGLRKSMEGVMGRRGGRGGRGGEEGGRGGRGGQEGGRGGRGGRGGNREGGGGGGNRGGGGGN